MTDQPHGLARGLTNYADFSLYLRRSFAKSMGYSRAMVAHPVIGIAQSQSGFNDGCIEGRGVGAGAEPGRSDLPGMSVSSTAPLSRLGSSSLWETAEKGIMSTTLS